MMLVRLGAAQLSNRNPSRTVSVVSNLSTFTRNFPRSIAQPCPPSPQLPSGRARTVMHLRSSEQWSSWNSPRLARQDMRRTRCVGANDTSILGMSCEGEGGGDRWVQPSLQVEGSEGSLMCEPHTRCRESEPESSLHTSWTKTRRRRGCPTAPHPHLNRSYPLKGCLNLLY